MVNIDLTSDELITRLKEGKIYTADKTSTALNNFLNLIKFYNCGIGLERSRVKSIGKWKVKCPKTLQ
jgi:phosphopantetheine adenylyltransferase